MNFPASFDVVLLGSSQMQDSLNWFLDFSQRQLVYVLLLSDCSHGRRMIWGFLLHYLADITLKELSFEYSMLEGQKRLLMDLPAPTLIPAVNARGLQTRPVEGQVVNIFSFAACTQLLHYSTLP